MDLAVGALGLVVGVLYGLFGAGGSAFATPLLALIGVPTLAAVASPLPATIPGAAVGAWAYRKEIDGPLLRTTLVGAVPAVVVGAVAAPHVPGQGLLVLSGVLLLVLGLRLAGPVPDRSGEGRSPRRAALIVPVAALVGLLTGLLANSGGFLLVPMFILVAGLDARRAVGTSLLAASVLSVPTLVVHSVVGDVDWRVAGAFALGLIPGTGIGATWARRLPMSVVQRCFGVALAAFAVYFLIRLVLG